MTIQEFRNYMASGKPVVVARDDIDCNHHILSPCSAITFFRQKPGKCNHAPQVATTLIANRLLAPKTSKCERNLPINHTFRSHLARF